MRGEEEQQENLFSGSLLFLRMSSRIGALSSRLQARRRNATSLDTPWGGAAPACMVVIILLVLATSIQARSDSHLRHVITAGLPNVEWPGLENEVTPEVEKDGNLRVILSQLANQDATELRPHTVIIELKSTRAVRVLADCIELVCDTMLTVAGGREGSGPGCPQSGGKSTASRETDISAQQKNATVGGASRKESERNQEQHVNRTASRAS